MRAAGIQRSLSVFIRSRLVRSPQAAVNPSGWLLWTVPRIWLRARPGRDQAVPSSSFAESTRSIRERKVTVGLLV